MAKILYEWCEVANKRSYTKEDAQYAVNLARKKHWKKSRKGITIALPAIFSTLQNKGQPMTEEKKENEKWQGRPMSEEELNEWKKSFTDIEESIEALYSEGGTDV